MCLLFLLKHRTAAWLSGAFVYDHLYLFWQQNSAVAAENGIVRNPRLYGQRKRLGGVRVWSVAITAGRYVYTQAAALTDEERRGL